MRFSNKKATCEVMHIYIANETADSIIIRESYHLKRESFALEILEFKRFTIVTVS